MAKISRDGQISLLANLTSRQQQPTTTASRKAYAGRQRQRNCHHPTRRQPLT